MTVERQFAEDRLAALYDRFYPPERRADFAFYLPPIMAARSPTVSWMKLAIALE